ncbi:MAG: radical SAM protein [Desulfobulbaceae bacterium]|nr:radical SAM protein [Desulfobulbaceae bacterium]
MGLLNILRRRREFLSLDWIQIEVTSLCKASCFYCPHTTYKDHWRHGSMSLETFKRIAPAFKVANLIFLQGWGEPFMNEDLFKMIEIAKKVGCQVGLTTNGMALGSETINQLIDLKLDILAISLAGTESETHNRLRAGTDFGCITRSLLELKEKKARKNVLLPRVHLAYIMLKSNFEDLWRIVDYAKQVGSGDIVCSNLAFLPQHDLHKEAIFLDEANKGYYEETLNRVKTKAKEDDVNFFFYRPFPDRPLPVCTENPLRSCYISHNGFLSSCVFTNLPILEGVGPSDIERKESTGPEPITYGNITQQTISEIWNSKLYKDFRHTFELRQKSIKESIDFVIDSAVLPMIEPGKRMIQNDDHLKELPDFCKNCYKIFGV